MKQLTKSCYAYVEIFVHNNSNQIVNFNWFNA